MQHKLHQEERESGCSVHANQPNKGCTTYNNYDKHMPAGCVRIVA